MLQVAGPGQVTHGPPWAPQAAGELPGAQVPVTSTQPAQAWARHSPAAQVCVPMHAWQVDPPVPQAPGSPPSRQTPLGLQHPAQLEAQGCPPSGAATHSPLWHASEGLQEAHAEPPAPQPRGLVPSRQRPLDSQHPLQVAALQPAEGCPQENTAAIRSPVERAIAKSAGQPRHIGAAPCWTLLRTCIGASPAVPLVALPGVVTLGRHAGQDALNASRVPNSTMFDPKQSSDRLGSVTRPSHACHRGEPRDDGLFATWLDRRRSSQF